jgi:hypothetical protein
MTWDDLWLAAKYQSNLEIAGSPRKVYRDRGMNGILVVEHRMGERAQAISSNRTPNNRMQKRARQSYRAKLIWLKGNNPDFRLRPLNLH